MNYRNTDYATDDLGNRIEPVQLCPMPDLDQFVHALTCLITRRLQRQHLSSAEQALALEAYEVTHSALNLIQKLLPAEFSMLDAAAKTEEERAHLALVASSLPRP